MAYLVIALACYFAPFSKFGSLCCYIMYINISISMTGSLKPKLHIDHGGKHCLIWWDKYIHIYLYIMPQDSQCHIVVVTSVLCASTDEHSFNPDHSPFLNQTKLKLK